MIKKNIKKTIDLLDQNIKQVIKSCGGFKHCKDKEYDNKDSDCLECLKDYEEAMKELNNRDRKDD